MQKNIITTAVNQILKADKIKPNGINMTKYNWLKLKPWSQYTQLKLILKRLARMGYTLLLYIVEQNNFKKIVNRIFKIIYFIT